jgi:hypothetical protein
MNRLDKFITGITAFSLLASAGCAGGLRNLFTGDETAGYKTLEELEAEESGKSETAVAETSRPRWFSIGRTTETSVAEAESDIQNESATPETTAWWKSPFRRQNQIESDPFLTDESKTVAAEKSVLAATEESVAAKVAKSTTEAAEKTTASIAAMSETAADDNVLPEKAIVRSVSDQRRKEAEEFAARAADEELVQKFERHFQDETVQTANEGDAAERLIVAGRQEAIASSDDALADAADRKLEELERLLTDKQSAATKSVRQSTSQAVASTTSAADDFFASARAAASTSRATSSTKAKQAPTSFDELFGDASGAPSKVVKASAESPRTADSRDSRSSDSQSQMTADTTVQSVNVSDAELLFGPGATSSNARVRNGSARQPVRGNDRFESTESNRDDDFAQSFAAGTSRAANGDRSGSVESGEAWAAGVRASSTGSSRTPIRSVSAPKAVSNNSSTTESADGFFTTAPLEVGNNGMPVVASTGSKAVAVGTAKSGGGSGRFSYRTWLLAIGGIIVVALLFAPGRNKQNQGTAVAPGT